MPTPTPTNHRHIRTPERTPRQDVWRAAAVVLGVGCTLLFVATVGFAVAARYETALRFLVAGVSVGFLMWACSWAAATGMRRRTER